MKNQSKHLNLFKSLTGKTALKTPKTNEDLKVTVGYWPSWAGNVKRR
jgi:hypothetical protein